MIAVVVEDDETTVDDGRAIQQEIQQDIAAGMAAIDVFENEPVLQGQALLRLENCLCTPHIGYVEQESYELYFSQAFDSILAWLDGKPINLVNPQALEIRDRLLTNR